MEMLEQALTILQQATALDMSGDTKAADEMYVAAKIELVDAALYLPHEHAEVIYRHVEEIDRRIEGMNHNRWIKEGGRDEFPTFPVEYVPRPAPVKKFVVPSSPTFRVLWLMRLLERSIRRGAFVTPDLYVGREVWYQHGGGAALKHTGPKIRYMTALCEAIEQLRVVVNFDKLDAAAKSLRKYIKRLEGLTTALEEEIGIRADGVTPPRSKLERGMRGLFHKGQKVLRTWMNQEQNMELCLMWAVSTLMEAQFFERWITDYSNQHLTPEMEEVMELLRRVVELLYSGLCSFLLRDMEILIGRYQEKCRKSITSLLPVEVKLGDTAS
ncbi:putative 40S ribosomal protein S33 [Trypanosoma rangeli]|uniref:Putative 40S ribosomal protein S33 n=1 Tax=Trypanosoma rangeli TaxID=5698 RepID=A0A3R7KFL2_TRYRA|nr:putative 40S ribosomal protein S33 [Trypanosoma rangeli]RNE99488.1 putative 40S ribosomal protein S33 [Trypanosoma rangeli]|eukprot:RNE99488.1 putative 40S ribosomal protein S33 [Trypanosoma rangeli]